MLARPATPRWGAAAKSEPWPTNQGRGGQNLVSDMWALRCRRTRQLGGGRQPNLSRGRPIRAGSESRIRHVGFEVVAKGPIGCEGHTYGGGILHSGAVRRTVSGQRSLCCVPLRWEVSRCGRLHDAKLST